ncbi:MAG TPA: ACT domain-containing protein [Abditibacteriaceae bacterium]|nr:ACT domain-containing protein [Abditibacteriaceae bacterium]
MIIITAVGADRPGMTHALADVLARTGCNIEDTSMTRLCGEFSMILVVEPPPDLTVAELGRQLAPLEASHGLFINCKEFAEAALPAAAPDAPRCILSVYGTDQRGLVARITGVLAAHNVNITDLQTRVASDGTVYVMVIELELPPGLSLETLQAALDAAAQEMRVQVSLRLLEEDVM